MRFSVQILAASLTLAAQGFNPANPVREHIYFGGKLIAVESIPNQPPVSNGYTPPGGVGSGTGGVFKIRVKDPNGPANLNETHVYIGEIDDPNSACHMYFKHATSGIYFYKASDATWVYIDTVPGTAGPTEVEDAFCKLFKTGSGAAVSATDPTVAEISINATLKSALPNPIKIWVKASDLQGNIANYSEQLPPYSSTAGRRAILTDPPPGETLVSTTEVFSWNAGTGAQQYWLDIGTSLGQGNISNGALTGLSKSVSNIPCTGGAGTKIYARLWTMIGGAWQTPLDYTFMCSTNNNGLAKLARPFAGSTLTTSIVKFSWVTGVGATDYWLDVGSASGQGNYFGGIVAGTSIQVPNVQCNNGTTYVGLWTRVNGAWLGPNLYTFPCNLSDGRAQLASQKPGTKFDQMFHEFSWSPGTNAQAYWLDVGPSLGNGSYSAGIITSTQKFAPRFPTSGSVWVRLWTRINGTWQTPIDYQFVSPP